MLAENEDEVEEKRQRENRAEKRVNEPNSTNQRLTGP